MKLIRFQENGKWSQPGYLAEVYIEKSDGILARLRGSTWPNPFNPKDNEIALANYAGAVAPGKYKARFSMRAHNGDPGFDIENNGRIPTICPNPNQNGKQYADHVDIHVGWSDTWRGSKACLTIHPKDWAAFVTSFEEGENVQVIIERRYNEVS
jgi:hypothetical protein